MITPGQRLICGLIWGLICGLFARATCLAADYRPSPDEPLASRQSRFQRADAYLQGLDTNHNGQIDANEVQGPQAPIFQKYYVERTGIPPNFPLPVGQIRAALADWFRLSGDQIPPPPATATKSAATATATSSSGSASQTSNSNAATAPLVPGFGVAGGGLPTIPGFGAPADLASAPAFGRAVSYSSTPYSYSPSSYGSGTNSSASGSTSDGPYRSQARSIVRQYDANNNGVLDRDEWKDLHGSIDYQAVANRGGAVTVDALTYYLWKRDGGKLTSSPSSSPYASSSTSASSSISGRSRTSPADSSRNVVAAGDSATKRTRFLTPAERLPQGLPDWFMQKADENGQVWMAAFATEWTDALVKEFNSYDLNGDGVITAEEVLKKLAADAAAQKSTVPRQRSQ